MYTGEQAGAAPSFIKSGKQVECYRKSESLPAVDVWQESKHSKIYTSKWRFPCHGDGWCARISACKGTDRKLMDIIAGVKVTNAGGVMAQEILDRVLLDTGGYAMDDMRR